MPFIADIFHLDLLDEDPRVFHPPFQFSIDEFEPIIILLTSDSPPFVSIYVLELQLHEAVGPDVDLAPDDDVDPDIDVAAENGFEGS